MTTNFGPDDKLVLTNLNKVFWPEHGYTKQDLLDYYRAIAPVMLPYLVDRLPARWDARSLRYSGRIHFRSLATITVSVE